MTRCGTCWIVLNDGETVEEHAASSKWHAEMASRLPHSKRLGDTE